MWTLRKLLALCAMLAFCNGEDVDLHALLVLLREQLYLQNGL